MMLLHPWFTLPPSRTSGWREGKPGMEQHHWEDSQSSGAESKGEKVMSAIDLSHEVVSREKWTEARKALLAKEKELTRQRDEISRRRRELPWVKVEKEYVFDGPQGKQ